MLETISSRNGYIGYKECVNRGSATVAAALDEEVLTLFLMLYEEDYNINP